MLEKKRSLSLSEWAKVLSDANDLGLSKFSISGGEPTIYNELTDLIKIGRSYDWFISLNTNGSLITKEYAEKLLEAGLNQARVSLYSHDPDIHEEMRSNKGLWKRATNAIRIFSDMQKKYSDFNIVTQMLISKDNYLHLPEIMKLHYDLGSTRMYLSYLEGDFNKQNLLTEREIFELKSDVIPRAMSFANQLDRPSRKEATRALENLYNDKFADVSDYTEGVYRPENRNPKPCRIPKKQALILANGDVHPCNIVEYTHEPIVGNVFEENFADIWTGKKWTKFRDEYFDKGPVDYCQLCPMNLHKHSFFRLRAEADSKLKRRIKLPWQRGLRQKNA